MVDRPGSGHPQEVRRDARSARLSAALRSNLHRRKVQARARAADDPDVGPAEPEATHDSAGIADEKRRR